jgi:hypothetical protein
VSKVKRFRVKNTSYNLAGEEPRLHEAKQAFLSEAISDISSYIHLADSKVSIMMAALVALVAGFLASFDQMIMIFSKLNPINMLACSIKITVILMFVCICAVFMFGVLTIRGHSSPMAYKSKWYLHQPMGEYSIDVFQKDINNMSTSDIIENMAVELYKLNDIYRQKSTTLKWTIRFFSALMIFLAVTVVMYIFLVQ